MLRVAVRKRLGEFTLDAALEVPERDVLALVGESGSGKSTLLRTLAGLLTPDAGRIELAGRTLFDRAASVNLPANERAVGFVTQDYALFPHLSARDNVAFGLEARGLGRAAARARAEETLAGLGVAGLAERPPAQLSGGQQQRVAIARALVLEPALLLLDEPLAALDPATRRAVRGELRRLLAGLPCATVLVTHDPAEALALGATIAVLENGRVTQSGSRDELLRHPRTRYAAEFVGVNFFEGDIVARPSSGVAEVAVAGGRIAIADPDRDGRVALVLHPREITLSLRPLEGSARNVLSGVVEDVIPEPPLGEQLRVLIASRPPLAAQVTRGAAEALGLAPGVTVWASFKANGVVVLK